MAPSPLALDLVFAWVSDVSEFWDGQGLRPCVKLDSAMHANGGVCLQQALRAASAAEQAVRAGSAAGSCCRQLLPLRRSMATKANVEKAMAAEDLEALAIDELVSYQEWARMAALGL